MFAMLSLREEERDILFSVVKETLSVIYLFKVEHIDLQIYESQNSRCKK